MSSENNGETACPSCGFRSRAGAKFCGGCGEPLRASATCSACGAVNEPLHRFCVNCGRGIVGASAAAATGAIAADVNADASDVSGMPAASGRGGLGLPLVAPLRRLSLRGKAVLLLAALVVVIVAAVMLLRDGTDGAAQARDVGGASAIADMLPSGAAEIRLEPEPSTLAVRIASTEHHAVEMVSNRSAVVKAEYPGQAVIVVHNDTGLMEGARDGCEAVSLAPEGDYRLLLIKPQDARGEWRARFYVVGCNAGEATLEIESEGATLASYLITVSER